MSRTRSSAVSAALARDRLGVPSVMSFVMGGIAALTVAAGVIPTAYANTKLTAIPAAFLVVSAVLGLSSVGYVAMARHITNAGAFYAFVARGLGRPAGVGAALMALVAYNLLQVGLYGAFGPGMSNYAADRFGLAAPWWVWSLGAWGVVTVLGRLRIDLNGKVLGVLILGELIVIVALTLAALAHPDRGHFSVGALLPTRLVTPVAGPLLVTGVLGFVGFEGAAVLIEEAKDPRTTVPRATYLSLAGIAVLYAAVSWAMAVHYGEGQIATHIASLGDNAPDALFAMGASLVAEAGRVLYLTSLFAAMLTFHNYVTRYMFALGREGVLPRAFGRTGGSGSPKVASTLQSLVGLGVILLYAANSWDPLVKLFFWLGTTGGFGILVLLVLTSVAVICFFARMPPDTRRQESISRRVIAPGLAAVVLGVMVYLAVDTYASLLGVAPDSPTAVWLPAVFGLAGVTGLFWAIGLKYGNRSAYDAIGLGPDAATGRATPVAPVVTSPPQPSGVER